MSMITSGIYGLCVADALGVPAEFCSRKHLKANPVTGMSAGGIWEQPAGFWSDDSSMTLCLAKSIGMVGAFDPADILARFYDWYKNGAYSPGGECFDIGNACSCAINRYRAGVQPELCGGDGMHDNGNGSLMRILPVAYVLHREYGKDVTASEQAMEEIHRISGLTHRHPIAQSACGIYVAIACRLLDGEPLETAIASGIRSALNWYSGDSRFSGYMDYWKRIADPAAFAKLPEDTIQSGGYVVESLEAALWCLLNTNSYSECVLGCVNLGKDTDTTAAIAGGLAGIFYGYDAIPADWIRQLAGKDIIDDCICSFEKYLELGACGWEREMDSQVPPIV